MVDKFQLARENILLGDVETGQLLLAQALRDNPEDEAGWILMASIQTEPDRKRECLERVLQLNPENAEAWRLLGEVGSQELSREDQAPTVEPTSDRLEEESVEFELEPAAETEEVPEATPLIMPAPPVAVGPKSSTAPRRKPAPQPAPVKARRWGMTENQLLILQIFALVILLSIVTLVLLVIWGM